MTQDIVRSLDRIPLSRNLAETLARAAAYARAQSHVRVTLEHLLLALAEDPDAVLVLDLSSVDIDSLVGDVSSQLGRLDERGNTTDLAIDDGLRQVLEAAAAAAEGRRAEIDGAIVLAAIVGDGRSTAAHLLSVHGLTFEAAIRALQSAAAARTSAPAPEITQSSEIVESPAFEPEPPAAQFDEHVAMPEGSAHARSEGAARILASARQRVQGRTAPGLDEPLRQDEHAAQPPLHRDQMLGGEGAPAVHEPRDEDRRRAIAAAEAAADEAFLSMASETAKAGVSPASPALKPSDGPPIPESGPRLAPPAQRPLPPGALRPQAEPPVPELPQASRPEPGSHVARAGHGEAADGEPAFGDVLASLRDARPPRSAPVPPGRPPGGSADVAPPQAGGMFGPPDPQVPLGSNRRPPADGDYFGPRDAMPGRQAMNPVAPPSRPMRPPPAAPPPYAGDMGAGPSRHEVPPAHEGRAHVPAPRGRFAAGLAPLPTGGLPPVGPLPQVLKGPPLPPPPAASPHPAARTSEHAGRSRGVQVSAGQLVHNIPPRMRVAVPQVVEARIARAEVATLAEGLSGSGSVWRHELTVTKAMSVRLRAPAGGFYIETSSPETQWIENALGLMTDDYASWRWTVTPRSAGRKRLQLVISARTVGTDGLTAETALPDQIIEVRVRTNYRLTLQRVAGWIIAAVIGGLLARFGEALPEAVGTLMRGMIK